MKVVCLLSGGIDSPVAAYTLGRNGAEIILLHMDNRPYSDDSIGQQGDGAGRQGRGERSADRCRYTSAPHGISQLQISQALPAESPVRAVQAHHAQGSQEPRPQRSGRKRWPPASRMGQVASQTLYNIVSEQSGLDFPVLRPLIGLDKLEIECIAKRIGTYEISIGKGTPCTIVPFRPATMATPEMIGPQECG